MSAISQTYPKTGRYTGGARGPVKPGRQVSNVIGILPGLGWVKYPKSQPSHPAFRVDGHTLLGNNLSELFPAEKLMKPAIQATGMKSGSEHLRSAGAAQIPIGKRKPSNGWIASAQQPGPNQRIADGPRTADFSCRPVVLPRVKHDTRTNRNSDNTK